MSSLLGVVLAGGLSRRMQGPEKSMLGLGGMTLIERVATRLSEQVPQIIINANGDSSRFSHLPYPVQADTIKGFAGPLAGVLAAMQWARDHSQFTHVITAAADTPFFPKDYATRMLNAITDQKTQIALASSNHRHHPVFGIWPVSLLDALEHFLVEEENRKVMLFVERYPYSQVEFENLENDIDPFFNVNTPDDMKQAEKIVSGQETA